MPQSAEVRLGGHVQKLRDLQAKLKGGGGSTDEIDSVLSGIGLDQMKSDDLIHLGSKLGLRLSGGYSSFDMRRAIRKKLMEAWVGRK